ncbi:Fc receptor-like protein 5 [Ictalurus furcatus]|uniref:Fc receptor-like protein 5 n=1 Tax=Ictalurus furcatus TaxID=66913 RepID=UPI002350079C|nr:Fc receptor-like protein 5 [Ictalurus furcatus]
MVQCPLAPGRAGDVLVEVYHCTFEVGTVKVPRHNKGSIQMMSLVLKKPKPQLTSSLKGAALTGNSVTLSCTLKPHPVYYTHYSDELPLKVIESPKPVVIIKPYTQVFREETVTFSCDIQGGGDTEWTYDWYRDDKTFNPSITAQGIIISDYDSGKYTCRGRRSDSQISKTSEPVTLTVSEKPKPQLTSSLKGAALTGNSVTLYCTLKPQSDGWKFYWSKRRQRTETETKTHSYTINPGSVYDRGYYKCRAGRGNPVYYTDYSDELRVDVIESPKPVVIIKPDTQVFRGERVTFSCDIQGGDTEWTYDWYRYRNHNTFYTSHTTQEIIISDYYSGKYTCRGRRRSDSQISKTSDPVTLTVSEKPKPELTSDLKGALLRGNSVTLSCTLKLQSAGWKFYWSNHTQSTETEAKTDFYTTTVNSSVSVSDGGQYRCRAGRGNPVYYTHYSDALWVNVTESPKAVVIIKPDKHVFSGETVTLRCEIQGGGDTEWTYSWYKKDNTLYPYRTTQEFSFSSVITDNSGKYTCRGRRSSDSRSSEISDAVTLTVSDAAEAVVSVSPLRWLTEGDSVTLSCEVKHSSTGWTFSWYTAVPYRNGLIEVTGHRGNVLYGLELLSDSSRGSGGSYTLTNVTVNHTGVYMCRAERGESVFHTQDSNLQPLCITGESPPVSLIINPSRTQHFTADSLSLSCEDQSDSTGWTVRGYTHSERVSDCSSVSGSTCNISPLSTSHTGVYWCQSESGGRSNPVNITVHNGDVILESPVHPVTEGNPLTLRCLYRNSSISASGVDFYKDGSVLQNKTTGEMTISNVSKSGEGFYHCKHPERGESPKCWVSVRARPKPVVKIQPAGRVFLGETVTLTCEIQTSGSTWQYHWYRDNTELSDAAGKKTYTISDIKDSDKGDYTCYGTKSSDPKYTQTSDGVTLTVSENPKPELTSDLKGAVMMGNSVNLSCTLKLQSDGWKFYWIKHTQSTETETETHSYTIRSVSVSDGGQYKCRAGRGNPVYYTHYSDALWVNVIDGKAPLSVLKLLSSAVAASPYVLVTIILAVKCYRARTDPDEDNRPYRVIEAEASV